MVGEIRSGMGPAGFCVCSKCGYKKPHEAGVPCREEKCPQCGARMVREGSYYHKLVEEKKKKRGD
jgi:predicted Zn-ribbon and HTH transcriptional regulator